MLVHNHSLSIHLRLKIDSSGLKGDMHPTKQLKGSAHCHELEFLQVATPHKVNVSGTSLQATSKLRVSNNLQG
jgi:hypothetical protein